MPISKSNRRCLGITLGDPSGIGPEIVAGALAKPSIRQLGPFRLIGDYSAFRKFGTSNYKNCEFVDMKSLRAGHWRLGTPSLWGATASLSAIKKSVELLKTGDLSGLVTAPVCKETIKRIHPAFQGHTEFLARAFRAKSFAMMFVARSMRTVIVTRHIPICRVSKAIDAASIYETIAITFKALQKTFGISKPAVAVCGLNPHAGEGGLIGTEEKTAILPAIRKALRRHMNVQGPFAADTLFSPGPACRFDAIIAMYHDQGLIPIKTLYFKELVNVTIGLPFIRTSPAHGTAFDIAGKHKADPSSMCAAIRLADQLIQTSGHGT